MKRFFLLSAILLILPDSSLLAASQLEFSAVLQSVEEESPTVTLLNMQLTPLVSIPVRATNATEVRDIDGQPILLGDLMPGMLLEIEALFTDQGILAKEIKISDDENDFQIRGRIQSVNPQGGDAVRILVVGFDILVPSSAEVSDTADRTLTIDDLEEGQFARVKGMVEGGDLVASQVRIGEPERRGRIALTGIISAILSASDFYVAMEGGLTALIEISDETEIKGTLAVGTRVRVIGTVTDRLSILAERIIVLNSVELSPDELELAPGESQSVNIILQQVRDDDTVFEISSQDPEVATASTDSLTIPAGELTASFDVTAGSMEGKTNIVVTTEGFEGGVKVEVEEGDGEDDLNVRWEPRVIRAAPNGSRDVRVRIGDPAPQDLLVELTLEEGPDDLLAFPPEVTIPEGERVVTVRIEFLSQRGKATLRATLPESVGGDQADLDIDLRAEGQAKLDIEWSPDDLELQPNSPASVELRLDSPAPFDLEVLITLKNGNRSLVAGFPGMVEFPEGQQVVVIEFTTTQPSGNNDKKVRFRAALPMEVGGKHDDLKIEVEN